MDKPTLLTGKVASILNERELTINIGAADGVAVGMKFKVLSGTPLEVRDPETNALLGKVDREKVRVKASEVYDKFSICKTFVVHTTSGAFTPSFMDAINSSLLGQRREYIETLKADGHSLPPPLTEEESFVKKGDQVVATLEDE